MPPAVARQASVDTVHVHLGDRSYPIFIGAGLLERGELLRKHVPGKRVLVVTNETIAPLYLDRCAAQLLCKPSTQAVCNRVFRLVSRV